MLLDFARVPQMRTRIGGIVWAIFDRVFEDFGGGFAERFERRKAPFGLNLRDLEFGGHCREYVARLGNLGTAHASPDRAPPGRAMPQPDRTAMPCLADAMPSLAVPRWTTHAYARPRPRSRARPRLAALRHQSSSTASPSITRS